MVVGELEIGTDVLVIGAGPAGYTAAIRCGQLGLDVTLVGPEIGGVCLQRGCIPFKAVIRSLDVATDARNADRFGIDASVSVDLAKMHAFKDEVVSRLASGVAGLLSASGVEYIAGTCSFTSSATALVTARSGAQRFRFKRAVIATGTRFREPNGVAFDGRLVLTPYAVPALTNVPARVAVLGGGVAGATSAPLLAKMGSKVVLAYRGRSLLGALDDDLLAPALQWLNDNGVQVLPEASWQIAKEKDSVRVKVASGGKEQEFSVDLVVAATAAEGNTKGLRLDRTKVASDEKGFLRVDRDFRTADPAIYAIGDVLGGARNASTAFREGLAVAEALAGKPGLPEYQVMPLTIYVEPPIASAGLTENAAKKAGIDFIVGRSPYSAGGSAATLGLRSGFVKVVAEKATHRLLGVHIVGREAPDLLGEGLLALELGARLEDVALTLHPHPELIEAMQDACARAAGMSVNRQERSS